MSLKGSSKVQNKSEVQSETSLGTTQSQGKTSQYTSKKFAVFRKQLLSHFTFKAEKSESEWIDWIEKAIKKEHINYYEYDQFSNIRKIGNGAYSIVYRANWKRTGKVFALKALKSEKTAFKEIANEVTIPYGGKYNFT